MVVVCGREGKGGKVQPDYTWPVGSDLYREVLAVGRLLTAFSSSWDFRISHTCGWRI